MGAMTITIDPAARGHIDDFGALLTAAPSPFHVAAYVADALVGAGFGRQEEADPWRNSADGRVLVRGGAVVAWRVPGGAGPETPIRIVGAHTDSPALVLKPHPDDASVGYRMAAAEVYGGPLLNSWLNRDLGLAGRLVLRDGTSRLVSTGPLLTIPQLALHLDRAVDQGLVLDPQQHLRPLWGLDAGLGVIDVLAAAAQVDPARVDAMDIRTFDTQPPETLGAAGELWAAGRLDNLISVHAGLRALLETPVGEEIQVFAAFDHEEVGSATRSGAAGPLLEDVLIRIAHALGADAEEQRRQRARSSVLSCDGAHAVHPNYPERHDPLHRPVLNGGPVLKVNARQRYATDAEGAAVWARACRAAGVTGQVIASNNSVPCGSTIGPITATRLGLLTVDVGAPMLSMHSARELCGVADPWALSRVIGAYWAGA